MFSLTTYILIDGGIMKRGYTMLNNKIGIVPLSPTYKISYRSTEGEESVLQVQLRRITFLTFFNKLNLDMSNIPFIFVSLFNHSLKSFEK